MLIPLKKQCKKSKNDFTGPVYMSITLHVDLAQKSFYIAPLDNDLQSKKAIRNYNWKATACT